MKLTVSLIMLTAMLLSQSVFAHCASKKYYAGGGFAINSQSNFDETNGYQFIGGYCLDFNFNTPKAKTSVELGYMESGEFERQYTIPPNNRNQVERTITEKESYRGIWFSGLAEYKFESQIHLMGRLGLDVGDDNGVFLGGGVGYNLSKWAQVRAEYLAKNEVNSLQLNIITEF